MKFNNKYCLRCIDDAPRFMIFAGKNPVKTCHICANRAISRGLMEEVSEEYFMVAVVMIT